MPLFLASFAAGGEPDYALVLERIAQEIEAMKADYPQLGDFSAAATLDVNDLKMSFGYRTHRSKTRGGWTSGVPNPDDDGIWFYVDFHAPDSSAQIHTQPASIPQCIGAKRVSFLILEGARTKRVGGAIASVLKRHGAGKCPN